MARDMTTGRRPAGEDLDNGRTRPRPHVPAGGFEGRDAPPLRGVRADVDKGYGKLERTLIDGTI